MTNNERIAQIRQRLKNQEFYKNDANTANQDAKFLADCILEREPQHVVAKWVSNEGGCNFFVPNYKNTCFWTEMERLFAIWDKLVPTQEEEKPTMTPEQAQRVEEIRKRLETKAYKDMESLPTCYLPQAREDVDFLVSLVLGGSAPPWLKGVMAIKDYGNYVPDFTSRLWDHLAFLIKLIDEKKTLSQTLPQTDKKKVVIYLRTDPGCGDLYFTPYIDGVLVPNGAYIGSSINTIITAFLEALQIDVDRRNLDPNHLITGVGFPRHLTELEDHIKNIHNAQRDQRIKELEEELARLKKELVP